MTDENGQIMSRVESSSAASNPAEYYYYFNGVQVGDVSNNGPATTDYVTSMALHGVTPSSTNAFESGNSATPGAIAPPRISDPGYLAYSLSRDLARVSPDSPTFSAAALSLDAQGLNLTAPPAAALAPTAAADLGGAPLAPTPAQAQLAAPDAAAHDAARGAGGSGGYSGYTDALAVGQSIGNLIAGNIESQPTSGKSLFDQIGDGISSLVHGVEHVGSEIIGGVEQVGGAIVNGVETAATDVGNFFNPPAAASVSAPTLNLNYGGASSLYGGGLIKISTGAGGLAPKGGSFLFFGGAGDQGDYLQGLQNAFTNAGIKGVYVMNAGSTGANIPGIALNLANIELVNNLTYANLLAANQPSSVKYMVTASQQFATNGQQFNIGGYYYGSVEAADLAYSVAQNG